MAKLLSTTPVYITQYCLTKGLIQTTLDPHSVYKLNTSKNTQHVITLYDPDRAFQLGKEIFLSKEEALQHIKKAIISKRKSLNKQIQRLDAMQAMLDQGELTIREIK